MRQLTLRILAITSLATVFIIPAFSQDGGIVFAGGGGGVGIGSAGAMVGPAGLRSMSGNEKGSTFTYNFPKGATEFVTTGAPYSGHTSSQTIRTLANGTHLTQLSNDQPMTYRDTMGRTRTEAAMSPRFNGPNVAAANAQPPQIMRFAEITDPVAGYKYVLDSVHQIAYRGVIQAQVRPNQSPNVAAARMAANPMPARTMENGATIKNESLGTQTIFGVTAIGQRNTTTYPIGTYQGNDQPVVVVNENWRSAQYGLMLRSLNSGPIGDTTMTMKDFSIDEPDPSLFMVPAGYQVVDEAGEFTITIPRDAR